MITELQGFLRPDYDPEDDFINLTSGSCVNDAALWLHGSVVDYNSTQKMLAAIAANEWVLQEAEYNGYIY